MFPCKYEIQSIDATKHVSPEKIHRKLAPTQRDGLRFPSVIMQIRSAMNKHERDFLCTSYPRFPWISVRSISICFLFARGRRSLSPRSWYHTWNCTSSFPSTNTTRQPRSTRESGYYASELFVHICFSISWYHSSSGVAGKSYFFPPLVSLFSFIFIRSRLHVYSSSLTEITGVPFSEKFMHRYDYDAGGGRVLRNALQFLASL